MVLSDQVILTSVEMTNAIGGIASLAIIGVIIAVIISIVAGVFTIARIGADDSVMRTTATPEKAAKPEDSQLVTAIQQVWATAKQYW